MRGIPQPSPAQGPSAEDVQARLAKADLHQGPVDGRWSEESGEGLGRFFHVHNLDNRWRDDGFRWRSVYRDMQAQVPKD